jgi:hypothetical protein
MLYFIIELLQSNEQFVNIIDSLLKVMVKLKPSKHIWIY